MMAVDFTDIVTAAAAARIAWAQLRRLRLSGYVFALLSTVREVGRG